MASVSVTIADVAKRYDGDLMAEFAEAYIQTQIDDAVDFADSRWGGVIESRLSSGLLTPNLYKRTISDAVLRVTRNPGGIASENEGGYGISTRANVASGNLWFTPDDLANMCGVQTNLGVGTVGIGLDRGWR